MAGFAQGGFIPLAACKECVSSLNTTHDYPVGECVEEGCLSGSWCALRYGKKSDPIFFPFCLRDAPSKYPA